MVDRCVNLGGQVFTCPAVVEHNIGEGALARQRPLGCHAGAGVGDLETVALHQPLQLLCLVTIHQPGLAAEGVKTRFEQQRNHEHNRRCTGPLRQFAGEALPHDRMHQFVQPGACRVVVKHQTPQGGPIDGGLVSAAAR